MIIDDTHEIAFVHIPKCAGTTLRQYLQPYDSSKGKFTAHVEKHDQLGMLDYVHIPLFVLKEYFPEEFEAIKKYWSFAVIRDPYARFASSVSQRLKMYGDKPIQAMSDKDVRIEIDRCMEFLNERKEPEACLPHDYIHFQRQVDYIYIGNEKVVDSIYTTENVNELVEMLRERMGYAENETANRISVDHKKNTTVVYRNDLVRVLMVSAKPLARLLSLLFPELIKEIIKKKIYVGRDERVGRIFLDLKVREFIGDYYQRDIELFERVKG